jgi:hypothetical protein
MVDGEMDSKENSKYDSIGSIDSCTIGIFTTRFCTGYIPAFPSFISYPTSGFGGVPSILTTIIFIITIILTTLSKK